MKGLFQTLFTYNRWVNSKILELVWDLPDSALDEATNHSHNTLRELLFHMVRAEWLWRNLVEFAEIATPQPQLRDFHSLALLISLWEIENDNIEIFLDAQDDQSLDEIVTIKNPRGGEEHLSRGQMLMHLLLHSMQHRTEVAAILTAHGHSPGDIDFIFFLIQQH
jgi:uncharacterized damage-inducible protein DinB